MKKIIILVCLAVLVCVIYVLSGFKKITLNDEGNTHKTEGNRLENKTEEKIIGLPLSFESNDYTVFPIGLIQEVDTYGKINKFSVSNYQYEVLPERGNTLNLVFRNNETKKNHLLTEKNILLLSAQQLFHYENDERVRSQFVIYEVIDFDSNNDGQFTREDMQSLYLGTIDGKMFEKLTPKEHSLLDWKVIEKKEEIIFRTIIDTNKDGTFDNKDRVIVYETAIDVEPKINAIFDLYTYNTDRTNQHKKNTSH